MINLDISDAFEGRRDHSPNYFTSAVGRSFGRRMVGHNLLKIFNFACYLRNRDGQIKTVLPHILLLMMIFPMSPGNFVENEIKNWNYFLKTSSTRATNSEVKASDNFELKSSEEYPNSSMHSRKLFVRSVSKNRRTGNYR